MAAKKRKVTQSMVTEVDLNSTVSSIPVLMDTLPGTSENQLKPVNLAVTSVTAVTASNDGACRSNHQDGAMVTTVTDCNENCLPTTASSLDCLTHEAIDPNKEPPTSIKA